MILSAIVHRWPDFFIILVLLVANAAVGFWEEFQAGNAIASLRARLAIQARVRREGEWTTVAARELVPGDVIRLRLGDIVPGDARLFMGDPVEVDQSALTGESLPVTRKGGETVYSGSIIRQGEADGLVYGTGKNTYFGKTAQLVEEAHTVSHFQRAVLKIGNYLIIIAIVLVAMILIVALFRGDRLGTTLQFALVLTVAAIPVAMPTVLSVTMAVGARLLARKEAIVSRLVAIEELAGMDVLCSDKTGTLTQNRLTLGDPLTVEGVSPDELILCGGLASRAEDQDTIDLAVIGGLEDDTVLKGYRTAHFQPFDPVHKRTEATVTGPDGTTFKTTKGAPQVIMELADNADRVKPAVEKAINEFAARDFVHWGWQGPTGKADGVSSVSCRFRSSPGRLGIDHCDGAPDKGEGENGHGRPTCHRREIAGQLGLGANILDASGFGDTRHNETARLAELIEEANGFSQVFPNISSILSMSCSSGGTSWA